MKQIFQPENRFSSVDVAGLACLLGYVVLAWYSRGTFEEPHLSVFFGLITWVSIPVVLVFFLDKKLTFLKVFIWALAFRLCGLGGEPLFEDDFFRYLWDGYLFVETGTPYGHIPADSFGDPHIPAFAVTLLNGINYPDLPTIYGPTNQVIFAIGHLLSPGSLLPLQIVFIALDMLIIGLLSRFAELKYLLLYAWCPLVIKEFAFTAHPDVIGICCLLLAFVMAHRRYMVFAGITLALAVGAKVFALLLVPFLLIRIGLRGGASFVLTLFVLYFPFLIQGSSEFTTLMIFASNWEFNASLYALFAAGTSPFWAKLVLSAFYFTVLVIFFHSYKKHRLHAIPRGDLIFGIFLLCAPVVNPWYVIWVLPFAVLYPSLTAWVAASAIFLAYASAVHLGDFDADPFVHSIWVLLLEYGIVLMALLIDLSVRFKLKAANSKVVEGKSK